MVPGLYKLLETSLILLLIAKRHSCTEQAHWSYSSTTGPDKWVELGYEHCGGQRQSPIDYVTDSIEHKSFGGFEFDHFDQIPSELLLENNGHTAVAKMEWKYTPKVKGGGLPGEYEVVNFHFHWGETDFKGSEHTIDGKGFPLEMHVVCKNVKYSDVATAVEKSDGMAVLGVMFEISDSGNDAIRSLEPGLEPIVALDSSTKLKNPPRLIQMMPRNIAKFYRYEGSLTTPTCNEAVTWTTFLETVKVTKHQMELFRALQKEKDVPIAANYRPLQKLNGRKVYLNNANQSQQQEKVPHEKSDSLAHIFSLLTLLSRAVVDLYESMDKSAHTNPTHLV